MDHSLPVTAPPREIFEAADRALAVFIERAAGGRQPLLAAAAALASRALREGHSCLDLRAWAGKPAGATAAGVVWTAPPIEAWLEALKGAPQVVGQPGERLPLTLAAGDRLYLTRVWNEEQTVARLLRERAAAAAEASPAATWNLQSVPSADGEPDWQVAALWTAARRRLTVITGGPGSGKTRTIARLIQLLLGGGAAPGSIAVAAPTGKAAARLQAALGEAAPDLALTERVRTLHRLLGASAGGERFRHGPDNPLAARTVIIDEASMVDLSMMHRLLGALAPSARLVLVGDKDQLPAVDAGNVLGDLCAAADINSLSPAEAEALGAAAGEPFPASSQPAGPLTGAIIELRRNYRFGSGGGIHRLSRLIRQGDVAGVRALLTDQGGGDGSVVWRPPPAARDLAAALREEAGDEIAAPARARSAALAYEALGRFRILAAVREGAWGVEALNAAAESALQAEGRASVRDPWPSGRQVVITGNDYEQNLANGDLGVAWGSPGGPVQVWLPGPDGRPRALAPARLPGHEAAWALTIHKSQGSEFDKVLVVLPSPGPSGADRFWNGPGRVLTRELLYTAATRARRSLILWAQPEVLEHTVARRMERASGLREALNRGEAGD